MSHENRTNETNDVEQSHIMLVSPNVEDALTRNAQVVEVVTLDDSDAVYNDSVGDDESEYDDFVGGHGDHNNSSNEIDQLFNEDFNVVEHITLYSAEENMNLDHVPSAVMCSSDSTLKNFILQLKSAQKIEDQISAITNISQIFLLHKECFSTSEIEILNETVHEYTNPLVLSKTFQLLCQILLCQVVNEVVARRIIHKLLTAFRLMDEISDLGENVALLKKLSSRFYWHLLVENGIVIMLEKLKFSHRFDTSHLDLVYVIQKCCSATQPSSDENLIKNTVIHLVQYIPLANLNLIRRLISGLTWLLGNFNFDKKFFKLVATNKFLNFIVKLLSNMTLDNYSIALESVKLLTPLCIHLKEASFYLKNHDIGKHCKHMLQIYNNKRFWTNRDFSLILKFIITLLPGLPHKVCGEIDPSLHASQHISLEDLNRTASFADHLIKNLFSLLYELSESSVGLFQILSRHIIAKLVYYGSASTLELLVPDYNLPRIATLLLESAIGFNKYAGLFMVHSLFVRLPKLRESLLEQGAIYLVDKFKKRIDESSGKFHLPPNISNNGLRCEQKDNTSWGLYRGDWNSET